MTDAPAQSQQQRLSERDKQGRADNADPLRNELVAVAICSVPVEKLAYQIWWANMKIEALQQVAGVMKDDQRTALNNRDMGFFVPEYLLTDAENEIAKIASKIQELEEIRDEKRRRGDAIGELGSWTKFHSGEMMNVMYDFATEETVTVKKIAPIKTAVARSDTGVAFTSERPINVKKPPGFGAFLCYQYYSAEKESAQLDAKIGEVQTKILDAGGSPGGEVPPAPWWKPENTASLDQEHVVLQLEKERLQKFREAIKKNRKFDEFDRANRDTMRVYAGAASAGQIIIEHIFSFGLNVVPGVGTGVNLQQAVTGVDLITGDQLGWGDRFLALLCALPILGALAKSGKEVKALEVADKALVYAADGTIAVAKTDADIAREGQKALLYAADGSIAVSKVENGPGALTQTVLTASGKQYAYRAFLSKDMTAKILNVARKNEKQIEVIRAIADESAKGVWLVQDGRIMLIGLEEMGQASSKIVKSGELTLKEAVEIIKKEAKVRPDKEGFERALWEAWSELRKEEPEVAREVNTFQLSGKTAPQLYENPSGTLRDIDIEILSENEGAKQELFRKTEQKYRELTGTKGSLYDNEITVWAGWQRACDPEAKVPEVGGKVRAILEAVENKALIVFDGENIRKTNLENRMLIKPEKLTLDTIYDYAQEARNDIDAIRGPGRHGETEAKYVGKLYRSLKGAEGEGLIPRLGEDYEKIGSKALLEPMVKGLKDEGVIFEIPKEFELSKEEVDRFVSHWSRVGDADTMTNFATLCRFVQNIHESGKNGVRRFLEMGIDPKYLIPVQNTARLSAIANLLKQAEDFTEWWDELTDQDIDRILESLSLAQDDTEFLKGFASYTIGESETEGEYNFNTPFRPMVSH